MELLQIRGAPAIASLAALTIASHLSRALVAQPAPDWLSSPELLSAYVTPKLDYLYTARPTAVNLGAAMRRLRNTLKTSQEKGKDARAIAEDLVKEGREIDTEDVARNKRMSKWGGDWLLDQVKAKGKDAEALNVMTVCNTGSLATSVRGVCVPLLSRLFECLGLWDSIGADHLPS